LVILVVAAVLVWPSLPRDLAAAGPGRPPDLADKPMWGAPIDLDELVEGDFDSVKFRGLLGEQTGLALAVNDTSLEEAKPEAGDARKPSAAVVGFDVDSGQAKWQVDIDQSLGEGFAGADFGDLVGDGAGVIVVHAVDSSGGSFRYPAATIDAAGRVLSQSPDLGGEVIGLSNGVILVWQYTPGRERQFAYRVGELERPLWEAAADPESFAGTHNEWTGTYWAASKGQMIDVATGRPVGLPAAGADLAAPTYRLANGPEDLALRWEDSDGPVMAVDPATGEPPTTPPEMSDSGVTTEDAGEASE
jgi:hypothetical protein